MNGLPHFLCPEAIDAGREVIDPGLMGYNTKSAYATNILDPMPAQ